MVVECWINNPAELLGWPLEPLDRSASPMQRFNAGCRLAVWLGVGISLFQRSWMPLVVIAVIIIMAAVSWCPQEKIYPAAEKQMQQSVPTEWHDLYAKAASGEYINNDLLGGEYQPAPLYFPGSSNMYRASTYNPGPFDYNKAVRSVAPPVTQNPINYWNRMHMQAGSSMPEHAFYNIPDPTHMARPPTFVNQQLRPPPGSNNVDARFPA